MIELDQLWFTWSRDGLGSMSAGFRVRAASKGLYDISGERFRRISPFLNYQLPADISPYEFESHIAPPISLSFIYGYKDYYDHFHSLNDRDERLLIRKVYIGRDAVGRPGVYFTHLITGFPDDFTARDAIRLWHCPKLWAETDRSISAGDTYLPTIPYSEVEVYVKQPQTTFDFAATSEILTSILQYILVQGLPPRLVVSGQSESIAALIYCITHCIPPTMLNRLSFTTYESESRDIEVTILGTTNEKVITSGTLLHVTLPELNKPVPENIQRYTQDTISSLIRNEPIVNFEGPVPLEHIKEPVPLITRKKEPDPPSELLTLDKEPDPPITRKKEPDPPSKMLTLDSASGYSMINFLHWLANNHPEIRELTDFTLVDLLNLANEYELGTLEKEDHFRAPTKEEYIAGLREGRRKTGFQTFLETAYYQQEYHKEKDESQRLLSARLLQDFEDWRINKQIDKPSPDESNSDALLHEYLLSRRIKDIDQYIENIKALQNGQVYEELNERLVNMGMKPQVPEKTRKDLLARYKSVPLHAIFLYTSEDHEVATYISKNWEALDGISGDDCDILATVNQFENFEDAYVYMKHLDVVKQSTFEGYSKLPGLFFWDSLGKAEYVSFGPVSGVADIKIIIRTVFEEIHKDPSIPSVSRAKKILENQPETQKERSGKQSLWRNLIPLLVAIIVVLGILAFVAQFVSPLVLIPVLIASLLFIVLIVAWLLTLNDRLSETNFMKIIFRFFDALPLLRNGSNKVNDNKDSKT